MKNDILTLTEEYTRKTIADKFPKEYVYHNIEHMERVVRTAKEIAEAENIAGEELEILLIAAWMHDIGYAKQYFDNEEIGAEMTVDFLKKNNYPNDKAERVRNAIMATKMPQKPKNKTEEVLCDADLANLGKDYFFEVSELIRKELKFAKDGKVKKKDWNRASQKLLEAHKFHTEYARKNFKKQKEKNLAIIREINSRSPKNPEEMAHPEKVGTDIPKTEKPPGRGVETMFRNNLRGHLELSGLADNKANIMLSVNAIIISIVVSTLLPEMQFSTHLIIPTSILLLVCITTIVFATLSTRPKVTEGTFTREDIAKKRTNLLFFGNFHNMDVEEFEWGMKEMMKDREFLYGSMIRDFYYLGKVLHKKYKYLRICYTVFMIGVIISVAAYVIMFMAIK